MKTRLFYSKALKKLVGISVSFKPIIFSFVLLFFNPSATSQNRLTKSDTSSISAENIIIFHQTNNIQQAEFIDSLKFQLKNQLPGYHYQTVNVSQLSKNEISHFFALNTQCTISIGLETTQKVLSIRSPIKTFALNVSRNQLDKLHHIYKRLGVPVSGIYQEQSFERQILLTKAIESELTNVGVIFGQADKYYLPEFLQIAKSHQLTLNYKILQPSDTAERYLNKVTDTNEFLLVLNNNQLYVKSKLASLVLTASHQNIKLIGNRIDSTPIGALASVYTSLNHLAIEASQDIKSYCHKNLPLKPHYANEFSVNINHQIAENLNIPKMNIYELSKEINKMEKSFGSNLKQRNHHE